MQHCGFLKLIKPCFFQFYAGAEIIFTILWCLADDKLSCHAHCTFVVILSFYYCFVGTARLCSTTVASRRPSYGVGPSYVDPSTPSHFIIFLPAFSFPSLPSFPLEVGSLNPARGGLGKRCKVPQRGLGIPNRNRIWCISALKYDIWRQ